MNRRLYGVFIIFVISFTAILLRLFQWQVFSSEQLSGISKSQLNLSQVIKAKRGEIFSSDGSALVINQPAYLLYAEPDKLKNKNEILTYLASELRMDEASLSAKFVDGARWVQLADKIDQEKYDTLKAKNFAGLGFLEDHKRFYPEASMAAHLLGFVGKNENGDDRGYFGLEGRYDDQLRGRNGIIEEEKDPYGNPIPGGERKIIEAEDGRDLYLTIDKTVQFITESKLKEGLEKYGASQGSVIVMDPKKGSVLAMASMPVYNPGLRDQFDISYYKNPAISSSYEPGSTFKVLVMGSALNEDKIKTDTEYDEKGPVTIANYQIKTWNSKYHGKIKIPEIIQYSSNVGMVFIQEALGQELLLSYLHKLRMGKMTEIDLEDEATPELREDDKWYTIDYATASFGQGIAVTPLQMVRMVAAIANGGKLMQPYLVEKIVSENGRNVKIEPKVEDIVYKEEATRLVTEMMVNAVEKGETKFLKPIGIRIAGKTGTAQIPISGHYDTDKTIASFVGFLPADEPKFIMLVTLREPTSSPWGSETAAPLFMAIAKELIAYYNILPDY